MAASVRVVVLATSLDERSRSRVVGGRVRAMLEERGVPVAFADLREYRLPFCGAQGCYENEDVRRLRALLEGATHIVWAVPIYNYDVNAVAKNVVELMGEAMRGKVVGFVCAAGGTRSFMAVMPFANSLMLDLRCWVVPRFVYVTKGDVGEGGVLSDEVEGRVRGLVGEMMRVGGLCEDVKT